MYVALMSSQSRASMLVPSIIRHSRRDFWSLAAMGVTALLVAGVSHGVLLHEHGRLITQAGVSHSTFVVC